MTTSTRCSVIWSSATIFGRAPARAAYLALKEELAARFRGDREAYSKGKTAFIDELVSSLGGAGRRTPWDR